MNTQPQPQSQKQKSQQTHNPKPSHLSLHSSQLKYPQSHIYYLKGIKQNNQQILMKMQTSHIMILFFFIDGLHILNKQQLFDKIQIKQKLIQYILNLQLNNGGFTCSTLYSKINLNNNNIQIQNQYGYGHIVFTYSAINSLKILGAIDKLDRQKILKCIKRHQKQNGSFSSFQNSTQCDLRFTYSALSICKIFNNFQYINIQNTIQYINNCYNFDGGYGLRPRDQSHSGAIFCAIASYQHLGVQLPLEKKLKTINFLVQRQAPCDQSQNTIGIQGRVGKAVDSCYSFWAGASLKILSGQNLLNPQIQKFIMKCYKNDQKSFSKFISSSQGDPVHTFHAITGLKILFNQANDISLSQLLKTKILQKIENKQQKQQKEQEKL